MTFIPLLVSIWNDLANPIFDGVGLAGFKSTATAFLFALAALSILSTLFPFLFFLSTGWYCGAGVFGLIGCISLSLSLALPTFFNNYNKNNCIAEAFGLLWCILYGWGLQTHMVYIVWLGPSDSYSVNRHLPALPTSFIITILQLLLLYTTTTTVTTYTARFDFFANFF